MSILDSKAKRMLKHMSRYSQMIVRCYDVDCVAYKNYGGAGVTICDEWLESPTLFVEWCESNGYMEGLVLDKDILCDALCISPKVYSPTTCKFVTKEVNHQYVLDNMEYQAVASYDTTTGALVKAYKSTGEAVKHNKSKIANVSRSLKKEYFTVNGAYWRRVSSVDTAPDKIVLPVVPTRGKPIAEVDKGGNTIAIYTNIAEAATKLSLQKGSIQQVVQGDRNSLFGRFFTAV